MYEMTHFAGNDKDETVPDCSKELKAAAVSLGWLRSPAIPHQPWTNHH
jgi:hypothetical protein